MASNSYFSLTNHPNIYKRVYWGNFINDEKYSDQDMNIIFNNRNQFIQDFGIKAYKKPTCKITNFYYKMKSKGLKIDHFEHYVSFNKKVIVVSSPYTPAGPFDNYLEEGWTQIYPLYHSSATTFIILL